MRKLLVNLQWNHPVLLPLHSSDQTQPLDVVTFGPAKRAFSRAKKAPELNMQSANKFNANIMKGPRHATDPTSVTGAFRRTGICREYSPVHDTLFARVEPDRAANVREPHPSKVRREVMKYENGRNEILDDEQGKLQSRSG
jgi:hypothetical protein